MEYIDISTIDMTKIKVVSLSSKLKQVVRLCRACRFDEAEKLLTVVKENPHQIAAIKAQLAFFKCDFNLAIELIMEYFPYLCEWYSGNMIIQTVNMLAYCFIRTKSSIVDSAVSNLCMMYESLTDEQRKLREYKHFSYIPQLLKAAKGDLSDLIALSGKSEYHEKECSKDLSEVIALYSKSHQKQIDRLNCSITEDPTMVSELLLLIYDFGKTEDFIRLYENFSKSSRLHYVCRLRAIRVYMCLDNLDRAREAAIDYVKYGWFPIEQTDVMPLSLLDGVEMFPIFTNEVFREVYSIPKWIDDEMAMSDAKLEYNMDFDEMFRMEEYGKYQLGTECISRLSVPSGKIVVADPLFYMENNTLPFSHKVPKGEYPVTALFASLNGVSKIIAVRVVFSDSSVKRYVNALNGSFTQAEIAELEKDAYIGFPVGAGLATIADDKVKKEFCKYREKWYRTNKNGNFYDDVLQDYFYHSAVKCPKYQGDYGDYIDFLIPGTDYHMPIFSSGLGNGYYPVFWGLDAKGKICSIIIEFVSLDNRS